MRKVQEARRKLAAEVGKSDVPAPPKAVIASNISQQQPKCVVNPGASAQLKAAPLRSCLKKAVAPPALSDVIQPSLTLDDPFLDVRSPRKDRSLRNVHKVAHIYTPVEPLPLDVTLGTASPLCPATPQQKLRSDGYLQTTVLSPCTNFNIPSAFHQARMQKTHIPVDQTKALLGPHFSSMLDQSTLAKDATWLTESPTKTLTRRLNFFDTGKTVNRVVAIR